MTHTGQQAEQPQELLRTDKVVYYRDGDIPCIKDGHLVAECRHTKVCGQMVLSLIKNTIPVALRWEENNSNYSVLLAEHYRECSWFSWNNPQEGKDYDCRCPKIAWGIVAYLGYHCWIDEDGELDWDGGCTIEQMYGRYHDEALRLSRLKNKAYCKAVRHNDATMMQTLVAVLEDAHIKDEAMYVEQSKGADVVLGKPILDTAQRYIEWLQTSYRNNTAQQAEPNTQKPTDGVPFADGAIGHLPTINGTEAERKVFARAIQQGYMELLDNGTYRWNKTKSLLGYMCGKLYCGDRIERTNRNESLKRGVGIFPQTGCERLFGCNVADVRYQQHNKGTIPRGYEQIDELHKNG